MIPRLLVLTDRSHVPQGRRLVDVVRSCADAGATWFVLRELDLPPTARAALVAELAGLDVTVLSAREWYAGAAGVHLSATQTGLLARGVAMHGRSCHDAGEVRRAVDGGAAYVTVSPVAASASKPGYGPALGAAGLRALARCALDVPVLALGGVDASNAAAFRDAGAHGVAVMGAVMRADDPGALVRDLLQAVAP
ncbi:MAG: thiamine phosphate synthase [Nocardioidaceae bacterium]